MNYEDIAEGIFEGSRGLGDQITKSFFSYLQMHFENSDKQFVRIYTHPFEVGQRLKALGWDQYVCEIGELTVEWLQQDKLARIRIKFFEEEYTSFYDRTKVITAVEEEIGDLRRCWYTHDFRNRDEAIRFAVTRGDRIQKIVCQCLLAPPPKEAPAEQAEIDAIPY